MSQTGHQESDLEGGNSTDSHHDKFGSAPSQPSQLYPRELYGFDSSWQLYSMYSKIAQEEDNKMTERCQKAADGTTIFAGLFLAVIATSLTITFPDLRPNSQDTSAFYLKHIYQLLASPSAPTSIPLSLANPPVFSVPEYVIWVNSLMFLSAAFSGVAAVTSMLQRQWAQRYIMVTQQPSHTPEQRARIRAVFVNDTRGSDIMPGSSAPSVYIFLSIILYLAAGGIYLFKVNRTVFIAVVWYIMIAVVIYVHDTLKVFFKPDTLFYSPFSPFVFRVYLGIYYAVHQVCSHVTRLCGLCDDTTRRYSELSDYYREGFLRGRQKLAEEIISRTSSKIDAQVLEWTFQSCRGESDGLEKFFESIPGFFFSKVITNLEEHLSDQFRAKLADGLHGLLDNTFSSHLFSESVRAHRLLICLNATRAALGSNEVSRGLDNLLNGRWHEALQSAEVGHSLRRWGDEQFSSQIRRIITRIISSVRERDSRWIALVKDEFGIPDHVLQDYVAHGDSMSLFVLIHVTRRLLRSEIPFSGTDTLRRLSKFDIRNTLPGLQQDFCALWHEIICESHSPAAGSIPSLILKEIRHLYISLRRSADVTLTADSDLTPGDENLLFEPLDNTADSRGPDSSPSLLTPNPSPPRVCALPPARPISGGHPIVPSSYPGPTDAQGPLPASPNVTQGTPTHFPISGLANPTPPSRLASRTSSTFARQQVREMEAVNPSIVFGSSSIPTLMPGKVVSRDAILESPHLSIDSVILQPGVDDIRHTPESSPSYSAVAPLSSLSNVSARHATPTIETVGPHNESDDPNSPIPMEAPPRPCSSRSLALGHAISTNTLRREDHQ